MAGEEKSDELVAEDRCPICKSSDDCAHLVARMDVCFVQLEAGSFLDVKEEAFDAIKKGVIAYLRARRGGKVDGFKGPKEPSFALQTLVDQVDEAIDDLADDDGIRACAGHVFSYLDDLFLELDDRERTDYEVDGAPGLSTQYWCFWSHDATKAAEQALSLILADARTLSV